MLQPRGVPGPCRYILEVRGVVAPRKVFRIVILVTCGEFFFKSFRHHGADERRRRTGRSIVADAKQKPVVCEDAEIGIVLSVVFHIEV